MTVEDVVTRMTPAEYTGWAAHLKCYPPAEVLLSELVLTVQSAFAGKGQAPDPERTTGHWLEAPEARAKRMASERKVVIRRQAEAYLKAWEKRNATADSAS